MNKKSINRAKLTKLLLSLMCLLKYVKKGAKFNPYLQSIITLLMLYEFVADIKPENSKTNFPEVIIREENLI